MNITIGIACILTFVIHYIGTLAFAVRLVGLRTQMWSMAFAIFNVVTIISRMSNTLLAPLLAKHLELQIETNKTTDSLSYHLIILAASAGTFAGGLSIPSFEKILTISVKKYYQFNSFPKILLSAFTPKAWTHYQSNLKLPNFQDLQLLQNKEGITYRFLFFNIVTNAIMTISVLSCLYAGYLNPTMRATASSMNGVVNGISIAISLILIDPYIALFTEEVNLGKRTQTDYKRYILFLIITRLAGNLLAHLLLIPFAYLVLFVVNLKIF